MHIGGCSGLREVLHAEREMDMGFPLEIMKNFKLDRSGSCSHCECTQSYESAHLKMVLFMSCEVKESSTRGESGLGGTELGAGSAAYRALTGGAAPGMLQGVVTRKHKGSDQAGLVQLWKPQW